MMFPGIAQLVSGALKEFQRVSQSKKLIPPAEAAKREQYFARMNTEANQLASLLITIQDVANGPANVSRQIMEVTSNRPKLAEVPQNALFPQDYEIIVMKRALKK